MKLYISALITTLHVHSVTPIHPLGDARIPRSRTQRYRENYKTHVSTTATYIRQHQIQLINPPPPHSPLNLTRIISYTEVFLPTPTENDQIHKGHRHKRSLQRERGRIRQPDPATRVYSAPGRKPLSPYFQLPKTFPLFTYRICTRNRVNRRLMHRDLFINTPSHSLYRLILIIVET